MGALDETRDLLSALIAYPTVSADSNLAMIRHLAKRLEDVGADIDIWHDETGNKANLFKLKVFALLGLSFWLGSYSSFFVTQQMTSQSLLFSSGVHFLIGMYLLLKK